MGKILSTTNSHMGNMQIQLDKDFYYSGEPITGHIMLTLSQPIHTNFITIGIWGYNKLNISSELAGVHLTSTYYQKLQKHFRDTKGNFKDKEIIFENFNQIFSINKKNFEMGQLNIPFSIQTLNSLPSSLLYESQAHWGTSNQIKYSFFATLLCPHSKQNISSKKRFRLIESLKKDALIQNNLFGFIKSPQSLSIGLQKNYFLQDELLKISIKLSLKEQISFTDMRLKLKQQVFFYLKDQMVLLWEENKLLSKSIDFQQLQQKGELIIDLNLSEYLRNNQLNYFSVKSKFIYSIFVVELETVKQKFIIFNTRKKAQVFFNVFQSLQSNLNSQNQTNFFHQSFKQPIQQEVYQTQAMEYPQQTQEQLKLNNYIGTLNQDYQTIVGPMINYPSFEDFTTKQTASQRQFQTAQLQTNEIQKPKIKYNLATN